MQNPQIPVPSHAAYNGGDELEPFGDTQDLLGVRRLDYGEHAFLGLGDDDLPRLHTPLAQGDFSSVDLDPNATLRCHLGGRRGDPGRSQILERDEEVLLEEA